MIITRFAPSPTGNFHIGSLRTAIYNYLYAKKNHGKFILRIEDTDKERSKKEYEDEIIKVFKLFELQYDDLKYQSINKDSHIKHLKKLITMGLVYKSDEGPYKFQVKRDVNYFEYSDVILGNIKIPNENIENFSVARSDMTPTFILSNIIDDHTQNITNVIRGNDHSVNTIKQIMLSQALSLKPISYAHIPLIHDMSGKKLSKRDNITNVLTYLEKGYQKEALFNFVIKLGNSFNEIEYLNNSESINNFEIEKTVLSPAKFNLDKLNFYNNYYLQKISYDSFIDCVELKNKKKVEPFNLKEVYLDILKRSHNYEDINLEIENLIKNSQGEKTSLSEGELIILKDIYACVKDALTFDEFIQSLEEKELSFKKTGKIFRNIVVNFQSKLPIDSIIKFFGIQKVIDMIFHSINNE
ncbi:glutamate--tRNA ligase family protein [Alphaproteobacteria bacterium]|nr:glutamate--tRNA ligase family protein [Alphaproteobacteria bacterium]MDB9825463.1 glutamate--tRNA ligase family protein [Alphaproteobacteria bacterium]